MGTIVHKTREHTLIRHSPTLYELIDEDSSPRIGIFFDGEDAGKLEQRLSKIGPSTNVSRVLKSLYREARSNINRGNPKL